MNEYQKIGGVSGLIASATYVVGFLLFGTVLATLAGDVDPGGAVAFLVDNQVMVYIANLIIYVINGVFLVVLVLALYERLKTGSFALAQTAAAFGIIWATLVLASGMLIIKDLGVVVDVYGKDPAQAETVWLALSAVENGIGGGVEIVGGLWVLLLSWAALRTGELPRILNYLGLVIGVAGILTVVPALEAVGAVFGLGLIVWFAWVGIVLLRSSSSPVVSTSNG